MAKVLLSTVRRIAVLRAAGYSIASIAEKTNLSARTVARVCSRNGIAKSTNFRAALVEEAKSQLLADIDSIAFIKGELAGFVRDDISQAKRLREKLALLTDHLEVSDLESACQAARAISAIATSLKLVREIGLERIIERQDANDLQDLPIIEMSSAEAEEMRRKIELGEDDD